MYSNVGYTIVAAMAEEVTGVTWDDLVRQEVFQPLELKGSGFGPPTSGRAVEQPRGHRRVRSRKRAVSDSTDNTQIMGPAATVHMTLADLCTFAWRHFQGERLIDGYLSPETYQRLHAPAKRDYACGWLVARTKHDAPRLCWHNGSNTMWYAFVAVIPDHQVVVAVATNDGDSVPAEQAAWNITRAVIREYGGTDGLDADAAPQGEIDKRFPETWESLEVDGICP